GVNLLVIRGDTRFLVNSKNVTMRLYFSIYIFSVLFILSLE
ncbi:MAG: hypothetical protein ACI88A_004340, partial [Paraglaciecola sp.]